MKPEDAAGVEVGIEAIDVGVVVMSDDVLPVPVRSALAGRDDGPGGQAIQPRRLAQRADQKC